MTKEDLVRQLAAAFVGAIQHQLEAIASAAYDAGYNTGYNARDVETRRLPNTARIQSRHSATAPDVRLHLGTLPPESYVCSHADCWCRKDFTFCESRADQPTRE